MKKILFIAISDIGKRTGGGLACLAYYNALKYLYSDRVDLAMAEECCVGEYKDSIKVKPRSIVSKFNGILRGEVHRYKSFFEDYLPYKYDQYSLCVINGGVIAGDMIDLFHNYGIKVVVIHHNFEREYTIDNKTLTTLYGLTPYFVIRNERYAYLNSDANCFLTNYDIELFHHYYGHSPAYECLIGTFEPENINMPLFGNCHMKQKNIVITGSMDSYQTIDGILDFSKKYFPLIKNLYPDWRIIIAGRNPSKQIIEFKNNYSCLVEIIPNPPIMENVIRKASIFLCPTCIGGGLKLRLMDGLRMGLPVITHKVSSRGYDVFFGYPFFQVYDDEMSFKKALDVVIKYVNSNGDYQQQIRDIYLSFFGFNEGVNRFRNMITNFLD